MSAGAVADVRTTPNGAMMAKCIPRKDAGFREISSNIAAIDFGTTQCSVAYITENDAHPQRLKLNANFERVPNAALFRSDGSLMAFGVHALTEYAKNLTDSDRLGYYYFDKIKVELQHDEGVSREKVVEAANGTKFYLVDVIAQILRYLKEELLESLYRMNGRRMKATDFDWVITVPAIWKARGKQMMREAGYKAGLCSGNVSSSQIRPASKSLDYGYMPEESDPDKLSQGHEPEMAAIYCEQLRNSDLARHSNQLPSSGSQCFLLADIGGGTVDVTAFEGDAETMNLIHEPAGDLYGGYKVNLNFKDFLGELVDDKGLTRYLETGQSAKDIKHKALLEYLLSNEFEAQKKIFADKEGKAETSTSKLGISLSPSFRNVYQAQLSQLNDGDVEFAEDDLTLHISYPVMEKFFSPVMQAIAEVITKVLDEIERRPNTLFLVGGFGGSPYVTKVLREKLGEHFCYIVPSGHNHAVVSGAVLFRHNPSIIRGRKVDATYGIHASIPFEEGKHEKQYKVKRGEAFHCDNIFSAIVEKGEVISSDYVYLKRHSLANPNQRKMFLNVYASPETDVWYTTGKRPEHSGNSTRVEIVKIGDLSIDLARIALQAEEGEVQERRVNVYFDFSHAEIQVLAYDHASNVKVKCTIDSLSSS